MTTAPDEVGLERSIGRLLTLGTNISIAFLAVGFVLLVGAGGGPRSVSPGLDASRMLPDLLSLQPAGFIWLGLILVVATPSARVAAALVGYRRRTEGDMALIAVAILAVIATSVVLGVVEG